MFSIIVGIERTLWTTQQYVEKIRCAYVAACYVPLQLNDCIRVRRMRPIFFSNQAPKYMTLRQAGHQSPRRLSAAALTDHIQLCLYKRLPQCSENHESDREHELNQNMDLINTSSTTKIGVTVLRNVPAALTRCGMRKSEGR